METTDREYRGGADGDNVITPAPYPREFRDDVVAVARRCEDGVTITKIAEDCGPASARSATANALHS